MKLTPEEKKARADARKQERRNNKEQERISAEKNQKPVKSITISIEWKKSRTWGSNPHATAEVEFQDGRFTRQDGFTASGCGYDKESTVIAEIFNAFLKHKLWNIPLVDLKGKSRDEVPYGINAGEFYGREYRSFSGGIGTSCYTRIAEFIGGKFEHIAGGKTFDVFKYTDGGQEHE